MSIELLISIAGVWLGLATFLGARMGAAKHSGAELAELRSDIRHTSETLNILRTEISEIRGPINQVTSRHEASLAAMEQNLGALEKRINGLEERLRKLEDRGN